MGSAVQAASTPERPELPWAAVWDRLVKGERINESGRTITGVVPMEGGVIRGQIRLQDCVVRGQFRASRVAFSESLVFEGTRFEDGIRLDGCSIEGDLAALGITCRSEAKFERLTVHGRCSIDGQCEFEPDVDFTLAALEGYTDIAARFRQGASFLQAKFGSSLILAAKCDAGFDLSFSSINGLLDVTKDFVISGLLNLAQASVTGIVVVEMSGFAPTAQLSLEHTRLGSSLSLRNGSLSQPGGTSINLKGMDIAGDLSLTDTTVGDPPAVEGKRPDALTLQGAAVRGSATLSRVVCAGPASLFGATIAGRLWLDRTGSADSEAMFGGPVNFSRARLGEFWCPDVTFAGNVDFTDLSVERTAYVFGCEFRGRTDFNRAQFSGVFGCQAVFHGPATFEGTTFKRAARFVSTDHNRCLFKGVADFYFAEFEQEANFGGASFEKALDLRYAQFSGALLFERKYLDDDIGPDETAFADKTVEIKLRGCRYETLVLPQDFRSLDDFVARLRSNDEGELKTV